MQVYVRLGIRLLYKGWKSRMEGGRGTLGAHALWGGFTADVVAA